MKQPHIPNIEVEEYRLENGLQVLLHRDNRVPLIHLSLHYRVGSSYEKPGLSGFAHLFEHMMFQGSDQVGTNEHGRYIDNAGGIWNASTSKDRTNYYETIPSHHLELALWLEADRMRSLRVNQKNLKNQLQTVIEEKKQSYDNRPYGLAYLRFDELSYKNWAYAHPIIGSVNDLEKATLTDALDFHQTYYGPGNATLVLSGDLDKYVLDHVKDHLEELPDRTESKTPDLTEPPQKSEQIEHVLDPLVVLPAISLGYHMPELGSPEFYALSVLASVLAGGESSELYRLLVHDENWVTDLAVGPNQYKGPEIFQIWCQVQSGVDIKKVLGAIDGELKKIQETSLSHQEVQKAKNKIAFRFVSRLAKISQIGELLAHYAVFHDDPYLINHHLDCFLAVTEEEIMTVAQKIFRKNNRTLLIVETQREN